MAPYSGGPKRHEDLLHIVSSFLRKAYHLFAPATARYCWWGYHHSCSSDGPARQP